MLPDRGTGQLREVDTVIQTMMAGNLMTISVECRSDEASGSDRKHGIDFVEEMYAKHRRLPTHVLILVSEKGFTATAAPHAAAYTDLDIKLVSSLSKIDALPDEVASSLVTQTLRFFRALPKAVTVQLERPGYQSQTIVISTDIPIYGSDGTVQMNGQTLVDNLIEGSGSQIAEVLQQSTGDKKNLTLDVDMTTVRVAASEAPVELFLRANEDSQLWRIAHVTIENSLGVEAPSLEHRQLTYVMPDGPGNDVARYAVGTTTFRGDKVTFVLTESPEGAQQTGVIVNPSKDT